MMYNLKNNKMKTFRIYLIILFLTVTVYTIITVTNHGWNLIPIFFNDIAIFNWSGQFNFDLSLFLTLSALWLAWRNHFTVKGLLLGLLGAIGGMFFLSAYLFIMSFKVNNDIRILLMGEKRGN